MLHRSVLARWSLVALTACSDYGLEKSGELPAEPVDDTAEVPEVDTADVPDSPADTADSAPLPCDQAALDGLAWWGSAPFSTEADPTDSAGRAFWAPDFDLAGWSTVTVPDAGHTPPGSDRAYRSTLTLAGVPERVWIDVQSDDGIWLYVNGTLVGQWGGGWQEEGCVNDEAQCLYTTEVDPIEVGHLLVAGENVLAARVSNAIEQSYFQLHVSCEAG